MALSIQQFTSTGVEDHLILAFPYIQKQDVHLYIDSIEVPFTWVSDIRVNFTPAPAGSEVLLRRLTDRERLVYLLQEGAPFTREILDDIHTQLLYLEQEGFEGALGDIRGDVNMHQFRIRNAGAPVLPKDYTTKEWVEGVIDSALLGDYKTKAEVLVRAALSWHCRTLGLTLVSGSFYDGAVLASAHDVVLDTETGAIYANATGAPLVIAKGSNPTDPVYSLIRVDTLVVSTMAIAALKRTYAEAGLLLQDTNFLVGGVLQNSQQAMLDLSTGRVFIAATTPTTVVARTNPVGNPLYIEVTQNSLRSQLLSTSPTQGSKLIPVQSTDTAYTATGVKCDSVADKLEAAYAASRHGTTHGTFKTPSGFGSRFGGLVYYTTPHKVGLLTDLSWCLPRGWDATPSSVVLSGLKAYYVSRTGNDSNDGLSWNTALASITTALNKPDADVVFVEAGRYTIATGMTGHTMHRDVSLICPDGVAFVTNQRETTWVSAGTTVYQSGQLGGTPIQVYDLRHTDEFGDPIRFSKVSSLVEVQATPYSWAVTSGSGSTQRVHINTGAGVPDNNHTLVMRSAAVQVDFAAQPYRFFAKGIHFFGGDSAGMTPKNGVAASVYASEDCTYSAAHLNDCLRVQGVGMVYTVRGKASDGAKDGFNYHAATNTSGDFITTHFVEVDCISHNHYRTAGTGNATTAHEDCVGFRIGGVYGYCTGPGVADINTTKTYNVSCYSSNNYGDPNSKGYLPADSCQMWLHNCEAVGNRTADFAPQDNAVMYVRGSYGGVYRLTGSASIVEY